MIGRLVGQVYLEDDSLFLRQLYVADTWWSRFRGLQLQAELPDATGLLLTPCRSVHTCWMRFAIHILFLDQQGHIVESREHVRPWRTVIPRAKHVVATLEVPVSTTLPPTGSRLLCPAATADASPLSGRSAP